MRENSATHHSTVTPLVAAVERRDLPPVPPPGPREFFTSDTYALVQAGTITAEVFRLAYWDPRDNADTVEVTHEVRINGTDNGAGICSVLAEHPGTLYALAAVCAAAAELLSELIDPAIANRAEVHSGAQS